MWGVSLFCAKVINRPSDSYQFFLCPISRDVVDRCCLTDSGWGGSGGRMPRGKAILSAPLALFLMPLLGAGSGFASEPPPAHTISAGPAIGDPANFNREPAKLEPSSALHTPFVVG